MFDQIFYQDNSYKDESFTSKVKFSKDYCSGDITPFSILPKTDHDLKDIIEIGDCLVSKFSKIIFFGTGGSSLGAEVLLSLLPNNKNNYTEIFSSIDPDIFNEFLLNIDNLEETAFIFVSKSGDTIETISQLSSLIGFINKEHGNHDLISSNIFGISEQRDNGLRRLSQYYNFKVFDHPPDVGGRFSVFSIVGLLPAYCAGVDISSIRHGARKLYEDFLLSGGNSVTEGSKYNILETEEYFNVNHILLGYSGRFEKLILWHRQLWAESIGKSGKGSMPVPAIGPIDQHSQLQYWVDGERSHYFTVFSHPFENSGPIIDEELAKISGLDFLKDRSFRDIVEAMKDGTCSSLSYEGVHIREIKMKKWDELFKTTDVARQSFPLVGQIADLRASEPTIPTSIILRKRSEPRETRIHRRGNFLDQGDLVDAAVPTVLHPLTTGSNAATRLDFARWLVDADNPLTPRVIMNRYWQRFFGRGIVETENDFGVQGIRPTHPQLLDWLAVEFVESGWDVKAFMKSLVLSETYQQSSVGNSVDFESDPENRLLARGSRTRLDSEVIRDQLLAVTGLLNTEMGGRSIKTPQPAGLWKMVALPSSFPNKFEPATGADTQRRSIYTFWKRGLAPPQMTIFDAPSRDACIARRERTNTPLQALMLMNETEYFNAAAHKAKEVLAQSGNDDAKLIKLHESITAHQPSEETLKLLKEGLTAFKKDKDEHFAWTMIVHTLLNQDSFKNKE